MHLFFQNLCKSLRQPPRLILLVLLVFPLGVLLIAQQSYPERQILINTFRVLSLFLFFLFCHYGFVPPYKGINSNDYLKDENKSTEQSKLNHPALIMLVLFPLFTLILYALLHTIAPLFFRSPEHSPTEIPFKTVGIICAVFVALLLIYSVVSTLKELKAGKCLPPNRSGRRKLNLRIVVIVILFPLAAVCVGFWLARNLLPQIVGLGTVAGILAFFLYFSLPELLYLLISRGRAESTDKEDAEAPTLKK